MNFFFWRNPAIKSVWRMEKDGQSSILVGTAHFCPYSFAKPITKLIKNAEIVIFEGPLDEESMASVVAYGKQGEGLPSLYDALSEKAIKGLNRQLAAKLDGDTSTSNYLDLFPQSSPDYVATLTQGVRPWLAFFSVWSALLDWKHSMDVEAYKIALRLQKRIEFLESIQDQLDAMDGIPFERFVNFLNQIDEWKNYQARYLKTFLAGDIVQFKTALEVFPTRCESILAKRDPIFFKGITKAMEQGPTAAFVGNAHVSGLHQMFIEDGYRVIQEPV